MLAAPRRTPSGPGSEPARSARSPPRQLQPGHARDSTLGGKSAQASPTTWPRSTRPRPREPLPLPSPSFTTPRLLPCASALCPCASRAVQPSPRTQARHAHVPRWPQGPKSTRSPAQPLARSQRAGATKPRHEESSCVADRTRWRRTRVAILCPLGPSVVLKSRVMPEIVFRPPVSRI